MRLVCAVEDYVDLAEGDEVICDSNYDAVYYYAGVIDIAEGVVEVELRASPSMGLVSSQSYEAPATVAITPVLLSGPSRLVLRATEASRIWYRIWVVDVYQLALLSSVLSILSS